MPSIVLLIAILMLTAAAVHSLLGAMADVPLAGLERTLAGEDPRVPDELLGEHSFAWIHQRLLSAYAAEPEGWATEMVRRIDARLQAGVPVDERLETVILWIPAATAFAMPGRHVYLSRRLLERAMGDDQAAFVIAHEMAHHRLGHVAAAERLERLPGPAQAFALNLMVARSHLLHGAEREAEADAHGFNLCLAAGYDPYRCASAFDLLEMLALDHGDTAGVFGPDAAIEAALNGEPAWMVSLKTWMWERRRGYPSIRERKARLIHAYEQAAAETAAAGQTGEDG